MDNCFQLFGASKGTGHLGVDQRGWNLPGNGLKAALRRALTIGLTVLVDGKRPVLSTCLTDSGHEKDCLPVSNRTDNDEPGYVYVKSGKHRRCRGSHTPTKHKGSAGQEKDDNER